MKYILIILCLILSATIFYQFKYYSNNELHAASDSGDKVDRKVTSVANKSLRSIRAYSEMVKRPLFSKDRKPPATSNGNAAESIDISELRNLILYGVVIGGKNRYAIVDGVGDSPEQMKEGHVFKGWKVSEISADSIKFESAKGLYELFIAPNESGKKSGIRKSFRKAQSSNTSSDVTKRRESIFRSTRKPAKSPVSVKQNLPRVDVEEELSQEELDLIDELGDEGGYHFDPDEDLDDLDDEE